MRVSRVLFILSATLCLAVAVAGCSGSNEVVGDQIQPGGGEPAAVDSDQLVLRTPTEEELAVGAEVEGTPSPPTLSGAAPSTIPEITTTAPPAPQPEPTTETVPEPTAATTTTTADPTTAAEGDPDASAGEQLATGEEQSFVLLNQLRADLGVAALNRDAEMDAFARDWSRQMAETGEFVHSKGSYSENIAYISNTSLTAEEAASAFHQLWVDSPGHYENMKGPRYAKTGVGLYRTERGWYGTHVFTF